MTHTDLRVGWCPGVLRPMEAGDGFVLRVRPHCATLDIETVTALANLSSRYGNGDIDLTARANLQIRGVSSCDLPRVTGALAGLGLLDPTAEIEAIRNIVSSPMAGLDPNAACDIRPLVGAIEARLATDVRLQHLPAKWSIVVDDSGMGSLAGVSADLRLEVFGDNVGVGLADDPGRAICRTSEVADVVARLASVALKPVPRRMADLVGEFGSAALFEKAGLRLGNPTKPEARRAGGAAMIGTWRLGAHACFGAAAPFGALKADALRRFAQAVAAAGATEMRLTPWRSLVAVALDHTAAASIAGDVSGLGLIVDPVDSRLRVAACSGAPACHRGTTPVRSDALAIAQLLSKSADATGIAVHVSGCAKGCAHAHAAPVTLVGRTGRYDIVRNGKADGLPVAQALSIQEAVRWLSRLPDEERF